jgi:hypothetical protein
MKRKKIILLGFMGACPIAGVVWQHIHYIVGLQRLGHEVYYVEDRSNYPYYPATLDISEDFSYAAQTLGKLASRYGFEAAGPIAPAISNRSRSRAWSGRRC